MLLHAPRPPTACSRGQQPQRAAAGASTATAPPRSRPQQRQTEGQRRRHAAAVVAAAAATPAPAAAATAYDGLLRWCIEQRSLPPLAVEPAVLEGEAGVGQRPGFVAAREVAAGEALLQLPGDLAITSVDVGKDAALAAVVQERSELVGLALWIMQERAKVGAGSGGGGGGWAAAPPPRVGDRCSALRASWPVPFGHS